jgi:catechol 2,3-dioxygenase-like lactoylglutathione lyase family enzyme
VEVLGVRIVSVPVSDPDRSKAFYTDVLGLVVLEDEPMASGLRWLRVAPPGGGTSVALVTWFETMPPGSTRGLMLNVADIEEAERELGTKGVPTAGGIETAPWGRYIQMEDPDGNGIILSESHG